MGWRSPRGSGSRGGGSGGGGGGAVESVNGDTGVVVLTAGGLGAATAAGLADETAARETHEANTTNPHGLTIANVEVTGHKNAASGYAGLDAGTKLLLAHMPTTVARAADVTTEIAAAIAALINSAPGALDTLVEIATALGNDANLSATLTSSIATKQTGHGNLTAFAGHSLVADRLSYANGTGTLALTTFTAAARALLDDADASAMLTTLGLSTFFKTFIAVADADGFRALLELGSASLADETDFDAAGSATAALAAAKLATFVRWEYTGSYVSRASLNIPTNGAALIVNRVNTTMPDDYLEGVDLAIVQVVAP